MTVVTNRAPSDLDPHSAYDAGSGVLLQGPFEGLIRLKPGTTDDYAPLLAESWRANADQSFENLVRLGEIARALGEHADLAGLERRMATLAPAERRRLDRAIELQRPHFASDGASPREL